LVFSGKPAEILLFSGRSNQFGLSMNFFNRHLIFVNLTVTLQPLIIDWICGFSDPWAIIRKIVPKPFDD